ncbi:MAG TPA: ECF-type sigma factor [Bryobacteraceae bacterium]|nr:ECF-type sigma factor [Bryobacteraceae bacterium]
MSRPTVELLRRMREGDAVAAEELITLVYGELHRIARNRLGRERPGHTLQPTALVSEACLRLFDSPRLEFADRSHFLAVASRIMRQVLVDYARGRAAGKRAGLHEERQDAVENAVAGIPSDPEQLLDLDAAIESLAREHPGAAQAIEQHYFGGMTAEEAAEATGRSVHAIRHELRYAKAWLRRKMQPSAM